MREKKSERDKEEEKGEKKTHVSRFTIHDSNNEERSLGRALLLISPCVVTVWHVPSEKDAEEIKQT